MPTSSATHSEAVQLLLDGHDAIRRAFHAFKDAEEESVKAAAAREALRALEEHSHIEESLLYPALRAEIAEKEMIDAAAEEHRIARRLIEELNDIHPADTLYDAKFLVLAELMSRHMER